jgi:hypothetical protein
MFQPFADNIKMIGSCISGVAAICGGYIYFDGPIPASKHYVLELVSGQLAPIRSAQNTQAKALDKFLLFQQQEALAKAKADPAAATSPTVQERIRELEQLVRDTERRISNSDPRQPPAD